jgi:hypothetical protein
MNRGIRNSILAIIVGLMFIVISMTLFRVVLGGFGLLLGLCLTFFGFVYLVMAIVHKD